jgi:excisionase family DNA binding protein
VPAPEPREPLLTVAEIGAYLRLSSSAAYRLVASLRRHKVGARILVPQSALDEYLAKCEQEPVKWDASNPADNQPRRRTRRAKAPAPSAPLPPTAKPLRIVQPRTKPRITN